MEIDEREFKKLFPHLYREIIQKKKSLLIDAIRASIDEGETEAEKRGEAPSMPTVIDYLRRCEDDEEALQVIDYLERRKEISSEEAEKLKKQVREFGVRSFGSKKEWGYYSEKYLKDSTL